MLSFTKVEKGVVRPYNKLDAELESFMRMNVEIVRVSFDKPAYKNAKSAYSSLCRAAKCFAFPIKVMQRKDEIYLIRTDM